MKSLKVSEECWKAVKIFAAKNNWSIQGFVEAAIREKIGNIECVQSDHKDSISVPEETTEVKQ